MAQLILKFDDVTELETWLQIFKKYGLDKKIKFKPNKKKKEEPKPVLETASQNWSLIGSVSLKGSLNLNDISNLRDYAYED